MLDLSGTASAARWESAGEPLMEPGHRLGRPEILFTKIEDSVIDKELKKLGTASPEKGAGPGAVPPVLRVPGAPGAVTPDEPASAAPAAVQGAPERDSPAELSIDDFRKIDLRVARVIVAEPVPKSKKLLKLQVEIGTERRQIVAGIAQHYTAEELVGKSVVVVANLQPATLMGQDSRGMLLAASDDQGRLVIVAPAGDIASGSRVK